jgi:C1A family cysteine protease
MFHWKQEGGVGITKECTGSIMDAPNPPEELDWGNKVSEVREQGTCGKDWAMVAA